MASCAPAGRNETTVVPASGPLMRGRVWHSAAMPGFRQTVVFALVAALLLMAGCASTPDRDSSLREAQYAWSAAIRWGDFEGAWNLVDPEYRAGHPLSSLELERYKQDRKSTRLNSSH